MSITEIAIKRPLLITVIFFTLILFGWISYSSLDYNLLPKFEVNVITVQTIYKGASSDEIQSSITKPVEDAVASIEGIDMITSTSMEGVSMIVIQLKPGTSTINAQRDAERKINEIKATLPDDVNDPVIKRVNLDEIPILKISVTGNISQSKLYDLIDQKVKPLLLNVEGVGTINIIGGNEREIKITLDNDKLQAYGISATQINQLIANSNSSYPAGSVETTDDRLSIRMDAKVTSVDELRNLVVTENKDGSRVLIKDVASVTDGLAESTTINRINGQNGIGIEIIKQSDANAVNVSQFSKSKLEELKKLYASEGFDYKIATDQSVYTLASADAVMHDLFLAVLIVGTVMLLFLHSFRSSLFVLVAIPSAMIPTFILMYIFGFSLNLMTLMGLSLVVGILVDDSIVVLENIFRHLEMGKNKVQAAIEGRSEIGFTAIAITLVDVVVFLPLSLSSGMIGNILREFSLVVVFSTLMSLFVSFTLTPLLASRWAKLEVLNKNSLWGYINIKFEDFLTSLKEAYGSALYWGLKHKRWVGLTIIVLFIGALSLLPAGFIGFAFISAGDRGEFAIKVELAPETPLYQTNLKVKQIESILLAQPEVIKVFTNVGTQSGAMGGGGASNSNLAEVTVTLVDKSQRKMSSDAFGAAMRNKIGNIPGIKVSVLPVSITGNSQSPIMIAVKGTDMDSLWKAATILKRVVVATPGTDYVDFSTKSLKTEIDIKLDRDKLSNIGFTVPEVGNAIQIAFRGNDQTKYKDKGEEYSINVSLDKGDKQDIESVKNLIIRNSKGTTVRLGEVAEIKEILGQSVLERTNRMNSIKVTSAAVGRPSGTIVADIQANLAKEKLPAGILIDYQGDAKNQKDAFGSLGTAMLIGIILVYLIMVALYESVVYPFVVLFSIPVALIGAFLALALSMQSLSIFAIVGLIMLLGLVAKNGILIVDFTNHLKAEGMNRFDALIEAGKERLRPILMTTIAMITGMLPIALATGSGAEVKNGMAWVIIGGLSSSLILTLFLVPVMYMIIDGGVERTNKFFRKRFFKESRKKLIAKETIDY
jgi:HAE1 family hydrophobic/amphiphilic exporter-1